MASDGKSFYQAGDTNPLLVDRDAAGNIIRLAETCWKPTGIPWGSTEAPAYLRFSTDLGRTWSPELKVPQWLGLCEIALVREGFAVVNVHGQLPFPIDWVNVDNEEGGRLQVRHLLGIGRRRLAFVVGDPHPRTIAARVRG